MEQPDDSLLDRVAKKLGEPPPYAAGSGVAGSILAASAASYGQRSGDDDVTQPTGFDPHAAALFEAVVESAYLVANADGEFDDLEKSAFEHVVIHACAGNVAERQVAALLADLHDQLHEDGIEKRIDMVARTITKPEHAREVLRVAALLAQVSGGVSAVERGVLATLAGRLGLGETEIGEVLAEVESALA
jgi:tellurite resistance protein